jgi:hypothetical protein
LLLSLLSIMIFIIGLINLKMSCLKKIFVSNVTNFPVCGCLLVHVCGIKVHKICFNNVAFTLKNTF